MILQALQQLAVDEQLMANPDYESKPIAWLITVGPAGKFVGIHGTHYQPPGQASRKKPKLRVKAFSVPREAGRTMGARAFFLYDKAEYVLGQDPDGKRPLEQLVQRATLFRNRVRECSEATGDPAVQAVHGFVEAVGSGDCRVALPEECKSNDLFAFVYAPDETNLVTDRAAVSAYWKGLRSKGADDGPRSPCLVSGALSVPADRFPLVKGVPGGSTSGVALVSFNSTAFESYGWKGNMNAPISRESAEACGTALYRLTSSAYPDPLQPDLTLKKTNISLSRDTMVCYWCAKGNRDGFASVFAALMEANPDEVSDLYRGIWRGEMSSIEDDTAFYALTLSGSQGRMVIRGWFEATVADVQRNLASHFADLHIVRNTRPAKGTSLPPQIPLRKLLDSLAPEGKSDAVPPSMACDMVRAAIGGLAYPEAILQRAIQRTRAEIGRQEWAASVRRDARAALIKAVLNRRRRLRAETSKEKEEITESMDPTNTNPGYLLGRLMAVIERMQQAALGDINASVVDRFFSGASATPRAVFPRLMKSLRHHARKAKDEPQSGSTARWLEAQVDDVMAQLDGFPGYLDLEQQGLFVLGYHHQRHWLWQKKEDREAADTVA